MVTDFKGLNNYVQRPVHPFPSSIDIIQSIPSDSKWFAKLDAVQGYFQIPLDDDSSFLTTFLLPFGRFRYTRAPMGLNASGDEWCHRSDIALEGLLSTSKLVDDILIQAPTLEILVQRLKLVLQRCRENSITISLKKLQIGQSIPFAGHIVSQNGVQPDPEKTRALSSFPRPTDVSSLRSFLGLANQLAHFVPDLSHMTTHQKESLSNGLRHTSLNSNKSSSYSPPTPSSNSSIPISRLNSSRMQADYMVSAMPSFNTMTRIKSDLSHVVLVPSLLLSPDMLPLSLNALLLNGLFTNANST